MPHTIAIASGKGGVGKTTSAINLAHAMSRHDKRVLLIDGNLSTPNVHVYLGWPILNKTLVSVLKREATLKEAIYKHHSGLRILPSISSASELRSLKSDRLSELVQDLDGEADIILLDSAAGLGRETLGALDACDEVLIVTNPELGAVLDAQKTVQLAHELGKTVLGVVLNKVRRDKHELPIEEVEKLLDLPVIGVVPFDDNIRKALRKNEHPITHSRPYSKSANSYEELAEILLGHKYLEKVMRKKGVKERVLRLLGLA
ncbi:cell division ATPase MinD [Candidatus Woesearchaeota archaeon]|nr:cell division ATPase MinD [Candidatus Woesearchaeota archaeon]